MSLSFRLPKRPTGWLATLLIALVALLWAMPGAAQGLPARPDKPVLDAANVLPPAQETALDRRLANYNQQTGRAVIVATVSSLGGEPAAMYAQRLAEAWGVSGTETEQGVLLLVAPAEREVFITTARGVQGRLTDLASGTIVREAIIPRFRAGDMPGGITAGVEGIIERLDMDPADARAIDEAAAAAAREGRRGSASNPAAIVGGAIFWGALLIGFALLFGRKRGRRRHRRYGAAGAVGDVLLWTAISGAMNSGRDGGGLGGGFGGSGGGGGFGGFGGGGGGFNGGGAGGSW